MVSGLDHIEVMFDHHHRIALIDQPVQHFEQFAHILEMKAGGRLIKNIQRLPGRPLRQFLSQFNPLRLAARQGCCLLTHFHIAQPNLVQHRHFVANWRHGLEETFGIFNRHIEHIGDRHAFEFHF